MSITARVATTGLALALAAVLVPTEAPASPDRSTLDDPSTRTLVVSKLRRGSDTTIDFMQDGIIHAGGADGWRIPIRTPTNRDQRQLLGISRKGFLVAVGNRDSTRVVAVRRGREPVTIPRTRMTTEPGRAIGWRLSRDGEMLLRTMYDRGGTATDLRDLDGAKVGKRYRGPYVTPFDADAGHVVIYDNNQFNRSRVFDSVPGASDTQLVKNAAYASLAQDLIFARTQGRLYGPTSISDPGTPGWAELFEPLSISPNGKTAIGVRIPKSRRNSPAILDVRQMSDGALLDSIVYGPQVSTEGWRVGESFERTARWENNRRYVFQMTTRRGAVLVRCRLNGRCERASDYGGDITTPYESFMWW